MDNLEIDIYLIGCESEPVELDLIQEWIENHNINNRNKAFDWMREIERRVKIKTDIQSKIEYQEYLQMIQNIFLFVDILILIFISFIL